ncbi:uncharacterized membrane protein YhaH (DUF805 family) [Paenibacillus endophyticus]|uniref:Uncharacterized membrane protein YhaH (DUF805 family) n=1 Tax=Paenibacillus endophyticus TaxID=1294268 RepID=A0A7W5GB73_9BACL|nr:DUF805 domain-containing protein [Paenibacillus endophyticus]MBB3153490.1 uncharacterized membrane protein YhaH (DUF805 family) [Paenibacillus endophyticus]
MQWYTKVMKNYVGFTGRARRMEYWMFILMNVLISIALVIVESIVGLTGVLSGLYSLAVLLPSLAVLVRRLHDIGRSGVWIFIGLIPFIGAIVLLVFSFMEGQESVNEYGPNPKHFG